jgi:hypothetical protein
VPQQPVRAILKVKVSESSAKQSISTISCIVAPLLALYCTVSHPINHRDDCVLCKVALCHRFLFFVWVVPSRVPLPIPVIARRSFTSSFVHLKPNTMLKQTPQN